MTSFPLPFLRLPRPAREPGIAWVAGNGTGVGVVKIEIADHRTVGESGEVGEVLWPLIKTVDGGRKSSRMPRL